MNESEGFFEKMSNELQDEKEEGRGHGNKIRRGKRNEENEKVKVKKKEAWKPND